MEEVLQLTLVVDGVTQTEDPRNEQRERSTRRVLAVEKASLDAASGGGGGRALGQLRVEVDERGKTCARAR